MSYGLNVEMHKQVSLSASKSVCRPAYLNWTLIARGTNYLLYVTVESRLNKLILISTLNAI